MRKPKGYYHRYELVRRPVTFRHDEPAREWWCIVHHYGRNKGAGVRYLDGDPGPAIADEALIRRARVDSVTVPVYVIRGEQINGPYFGKHYGEK